MNKFTLLFGVGAFFLFSLSGAAPLAAVEEVSLPEATELQQDRPEEAGWASDQGYRAIGYAGAEAYVMTQSRAFLDAVGR